MPASSRMSAIARARIASNVFDRWLISITDMPTPGRATRSRCASSSTGTGRTAGPAEKLKMRRVVVAIGLSELDELKIENISVARLHRIERACRGGSVEVNTCHGSLRAVENDVFRLLDVQVRHPQVFEDVRQHARLVSMTHHQHVGGGRLPGEVD